MPVLVIVVVFFLIFLVMGVMGLSAMAAEHKRHLFSGCWVDEPNTSNITECGLRMMSGLSLMSIRSTAWEGAMTQRKSSQWLR